MEGTKESEKPKRKTKSQLGSQDVHSTVWMDV